MRIFSAAAGVCALTLTAANQQPQFRARVDLVQVDVVVTDRKGKPVEGLTGADFTIVQDGRPQAISHFESFSIPLGNRSVDRRSTAPARDVVTNVDPPSPRALVIVIDTEHLTTGSEDLERLRRAIIGMLTDAAGTDDVAIVFTGRSDLSVPFTRDLPRQIEAVNRIRDAARVAAPRLTRELIVAVRTSLWTVRNVISVLRESPHTRRAILYVSEGSTLSLLPPNEALDEVRMTVEAAMRAGVVIYAVDPRGLLDAWDQRVGLVQRDFLSAVVLDTGGNVVANASDTRGEIKKVIRENGAFYVLGYVPDPLWRDDKFHPIEVKVRNPDWRVRARKGYFALSQPDVTVAAAPDASEAIESALESGFAAGGVPLAATAAAVGVAPSGLVQTQLTITIGAAGDVEGPADLDLGVVAMTPDGKDQKTLTEPVQMEAARALHTLHKTIDLSPGARALRIAVRNRRTGAIGSVHLALRVPDLKDERLAIGGIMIGVTGAVFEPSTSREFHSADSLTAAAMFFCKAKENRRLQVTATITQGGRTIAGTNEKLAGGEAPSGHCGTFKWPLPLARLAPGGYALEIRGEYDGRRVSSAVPFSVR